MGIEGIVTRAKEIASVDGMILQSSTIRARSQLTLAIMMDVVQLLSCDRGSCVEKQDDRAVALDEYPYLRRDGSWKTGYRRETGGGIVYAPAV
jgi:hypothetical protein